MTTLPSWIDRIRPTIESLLSGSCVPDKVLIAIPSFSKREQRDYVVPGFLGDFAPSVEVVHCSQDCGPGTKLLGCLDALPEKCYLVLADDDVIYKRSFLAGLMAAQRADHAASFSYYVYRTGGLWVGQGVDGFSFWTPNLAGITGFACAHIVDTRYRLHDDLWISYYLATKGVQIGRVSPPDGSLIYENSINDCSLQDLGGAQWRERLERDGLRHMLRTKTMPLASRRRLAVLNVTAGATSLWLRAVRKTQRTALQLTGTGKLSQKLRPGSACFPLQ
jgi:hypothetical protein